MLRRTKVVLAGLAVVAAITLGTAARANSPPMPGWAVSGEATGPVLSLVNGQKTVELVLTLSAPVSSASQRGTARVQLALRPRATTAEVADPAILFVSSGDCRSPGFVFRAPGERLEVFRELVIPLASCVAGTECVVRLPLEIQLSGGGDVTLEWSASSSIGVSGTNQKPADARLTLAFVEVAP